MMSINPVVAILVTISPICASVTLMFLIYLLFKSTLGIGWINTPTFNCPTTR
jgi:hypothetical protein